MDFNTHIPFFRCLIFKLKLRKLNYHSLGYTIGRLQSKIKKIIQGSSPMRQSSSGIGSKLLVKIAAVPNQVPNFTKHLISAVNNLSDPFFLTRFYIKKQMLQGGANSDCTILECTIFLVICKSIWKWCIPSYEMTHNQPKILAQLIMSTLKGLQSKFVPIYRTRGSPSLAFFEFSFVVELLSRNFQNPRE